MSITTYAVYSNEATKLRDKGITIEVDENDEGNEQINITRDDGEEVKFNNLYNKNEVDKMALGKDFQIDSFKNLIITGGQSIPVFDNGSTTNKYCTTYNKLLELLRNNINNISSYINEINLEGIGLSNFANTDLSLNPIKYISTDKRFVQEKS